MRQRVIFLLKTWAWTVLVFIIAKVVFMLACCEGHAFTAADMLQVVRHGLSLDLSTSLYFLIVPLLVTMLGVWWRHRLLGIVLKAYFAIVALAFALAFVADTSLYPFWGFKLNASCLQYLATPSEATASVSTGYLLLRLLALLVIALVIYIGYTSQGVRHLVRSNLTKCLTPCEVGETIGYVLLMPLMVIGIRGGVDESTTNIGQVYFSQNQFLNHSAVNPVFSFLASLSHQMGDTAQYQFMSDEACEQLTSDVFTTLSIYDGQDSTATSVDGHGPTILSTEGQDSTATLADGSASGSLLKTTRPDIVIILLESCGEVFAETMPRLQQLKREGISFTQCYGNSWRTDRGTVCTLSGYPSFPTLSVMKMPEKSRTLPSIARSLRSQGYTTHYLYGGDINFTNMRGYLVSTGWEQLTWKADYPTDAQRSAEWGVRDDLTFATLTELIQDGGKSKGNPVADAGQSMGNKETPRRPFLIGYSTLSSHEPWDVPIGRFPDEKLNAFAYLDDCIGDFIETIRKTPAWENLLVVLTADHSINFRDIDEQQPLRRNHIPMLWLGGAVKAPRTIDALCNQTDLAATLLGQLGLPHDDFRFSRDALSRTYRHPTAVHNYSNAQMLADSTGYILYDFDANRQTAGQTTDPERLLRLNKAILQITTNDLKQRR